MTSLYIRHDVKRYKIQVHGKGNSFSIISVLYPLEKGHYQSVSETPLKWRFTDRQIEARWEGIVTNFFSQITNQWLKLSIGSNVITENISI